MPNIAAIVPAQRGDWETAGAHAQMATEVGQAMGTPRAIAEAAIARAFAAMARGDPDGVIDAAAAVRAACQAVVLSLLPHEWRSLEIEALIGLGRQRADHSHRRPAAFPWKTPRVVTRGRPWRHGFRRPATIDLS
jgi:hypothetical protein